MLDNIEVLCHSSIRISKNKVIYIDPFKIDKNYNDADIIFITHDHYDHYSEEDIDKVINKNTTIVIPEENRKVKCDVAFVPVGGTYTMSFEEAAQLINEIKPQVAVPIHYGSVVGTKQDAINFIKLLNPTITGVILMK